MKRQDAFDLLGGWETFAASLQRGYELGLDDYLNDVDARQLLEAIVHTEQLPECDAFQARLAKADQLVRGATAPTRDCIWGAANAAEHGWTREANWWYFAVPKQRGEELDADLAGREGLRELE